MKWKSTNICASQVLVNIHWTDGQVSNSSSNYPPKTIEEGVWPLLSYTAALTTDHSAVGVGKIIITH